MLEEDENTFKTPLRYLLFPCNHTACRECLDRSAVDSGRVTSQQATAEQKEPLTLSSTRSRGDTTTGASSSSSPSSSSSSGLQENSCFKCLERCVLGSERPESERYVGLQCPERNCTRNIEAYVKLHWQS